MFGVKKKNFLNTKQKMKNKTIRSVYKWANESTNVTW